MNARGVQIPNDLKIVFDIPLTDAKNVKFANNVNYLTFINNLNELELYCEDIAKYINKNCK